jgi:hypothetical protein
VVVVVVVVCGRIVPASTGACTGRCRQTCAPPALPPAPHAGWGAGHCRQQAGATPRGLCRPSQSCLRPSASPHSCRGGAASCSRIAAGQWGWRGPCRRCRAQCRAQPPSAPARWRLRGGRGEGFLGGGGT